MVPLRRERRQYKASPPIYFIFLMLIILVMNPRYEKVLSIRDQNTGEVYLSRIVKESDTITYGWIHSFEHIPWTEDYRIMDDNALLLETINIAGFGAGIPHNKGKVTVDDTGMIIMSDINEEFKEIDWINSVTALEYIKLNGEIIAAGSDFPHHESLKLEVKGRVISWRH